MKHLSMILFCGCLFSRLASAELNANDSAPEFKTKTQDGSDFDLASRKGHWTILYFYPKAETPGCTKEACAYRDSVQKIRDEGADVFGVSADSVEAQAKFHTNHHLNFTLLADPKLEIIKAYGTKMPVLGMSKRWTFIIDPDLKIRAIDKSVDPVKDAGKVAAVIQEFKQKK